MEPSASRGPPFVSRGLYFPPLVPDTVRAGLPLLHPQIPLSSCPPTPRSTLARTFQFQPGASLPSCKGDVSYERPGSDVPFVQPVASVKFMLLCSP